MKLYTYSLGSQSSKDLANALGIKRIKHTGLSPVSDYNIINWGASSFNRELYYYENIFNNSDAVAKAVNKLQSFKSLQGQCSIPEWTESLEEARKWLVEGIAIVARYRLNGHSGEGIEIYNPKDKPKEEGFKNQLEEFDDEPYAAPLYVKYISKKEEYRLHVFRDNVFFIQRKARSKEIVDDKINWQVRNHKNGFIFANQNVDVPEKTKQEAIMAVKALGLDFGAVDLIWNQKEDKYYVLEVNTAPGLTGTTLQKYVEIFKEFV